MANKKPPLFSKLLVYSLQIGQILLRKSIVRNENQAISESRGSSLLGSSGAKEQKLSPYFTNVGTFRQYFCFNNQIFNFLAKPVRFVNATKEEGPSNHVNNLLLLKVRSKVRKVKAKEVFWKHVTGTD